MKIKLFFQKNVVHSLVNKVGLGYYAYQSFNLYGGMGGISALLSRAIGLSLILNGKLLT